MPLDSTNYQTEAKPDLSKPSLEGLSWLLRHLPPDHEWNFKIVGGPTGCGSAGCALGLAHRVWPAWDGNDAAWGVPTAISYTFFLHGQYAPVPDYLVTPTMVADRIDQYLAETRK